MRTSARWMLGLAAAALGVVALRVTIAYFRGEPAAVAPAAAVAMHDGDVFGDALPEGAIARIGTVRYRARGPGAWAPDGEHLMVGGWDDEILAMNVRTGLADWTLPGHAGKFAVNLDLRDLSRIVQGGRLPEVTDTLRDLVPIPGGRRLLTAGYSLRVWDLDERKEVIRLPLRGGSAWPAAVSADGALVAFPRENFVRVFDLASGVRRARIDVEGRAACAAFVPDGSRVVAGLEDGRVVVSRLKDSPAVFVGASDCAIRDVLVSADGRDVWALDAKGVVTIRSLVAPDAPPRRLRPAGPDRPDRASGGMCVSPDRRVVAVSWDGGPIRFLDSVTAAPVAGPVDEAGLAAVGWSPDGRLFATTQSGGLVRLFGDGAPAPLDAPSSRIESVAFSPDGASICECDGTTLRIADAATGAVRAKFDCGAYLHSVAWTRDGAIVAVGMHGPRIVGIDVATGRQAWTIEPDPPATPSRRAAWVGPDASSVRWADSVGALRVLDLRGGQTLAAVIPLDANDPHRGYYDHAISADVRRVAVLQDQPAAGAADPAATETVLRVWNVGAGAPLAEIPAPFAGNLVLSRDGRFAAAGGRTIAVFDLGASPPREVGRVRWTVRDREAWSGDDSVAAFSPDATRLAVGDYDGVVHLFALPSCAEVAALRGHRAKVTSVAFSADGGSLVTGSADTTALVWDLRRAAPPPESPAAK